MKRLPNIILSCILILPLPTMAEEEQYNDCLLKHLKDAKLDIAAHLIKQACDENHRTRGILKKEKRAYNHCLLEHLVGIESLQAVVDIKAACHRKHR